MSRVLPYNAKQWEIPLLMDRRKTVTRRVCKDGNDFTVPDMSFYDADKRTYAVHNYADKAHTDKLSLAERTCPICPGDILYVRETWNVCGNGYRYKADWEKDGIADITKWRPSIHMPKEAARIWLKVTDVRVERLQDIDCNGAMKEGIDPRCCINLNHTVVKFIILWNSPIKKSDIDRYGWNASPWVWVIEFERCEKPDIGGNYVAV